MNKRGPRNLRKKSALLLLNCSNKVLKKSAFASFILLFMHIRDMCIKSFYSFKKRSTKSTIKCI